MTIAKYCIEIIQIPEWLDQAFCCMVGLGLALILMATTQTRKIIKKHKKKKI